MHIYKKQYNQSRYVMQGKTLTKALDKKFKESNGPLKIADLYNLVKEEGFLDNNRTKDSVRGIIRNMKNTGKIKRVRHSTYQRIDLP